MSPNPSIYSSPLPLGAGGGNLTLPDRAPLASISRHRYYLNKQVLKHIDSLVYHSSIVQVDGGCRTTGDHPAYVKPMLLFTSTTSTRLVYDTIFNAENRFWRFSGP